MTAEYQFNVSMAPADDTASRDGVTPAVGGEAVIEALRAENGLLRAEVDLPNWSAASG